VRCRNVQDKADKFGRSMTRNVTLPILAVGGATITAANNFNAAMANVAALGVPIERVNELKTGIQELSVATGQVNRRPCGRYVQRRVRVR
jgi:hypothetical protein